MFCGIIVKVIDPIYKHARVVRKTFSSFGNFEGADKITFSAPASICPRNAPFPASTGAVGSLKVPEHSTTNLTPSFAQLISFGFLAVRNIFTFLPSTDKSCSFSSNTLISTFWLL